MASYNNWQWDTPPDSGLSWSDVVARTQARFPNNSVMGLPPQNPQAVQSNPAGATVQNANGIGARSPFPTLANAWSDLVNSHTAGQDALHSNFQKYLSAVGKTNDQNQARLPAEQKVIQGAMDNTQSTLDQFTNDAAARQSATNDQAKGELATQASDLAKSLQASRDNFGAQLNAEIGKLSEGLKTTRNAGYNSALQASDLASASARADAASRGAIQPFDLTQNEAIGTANRIGAQNQFYGQQRQDLGTISGLRQNQIAASTGMQRADTQNLADVSRSNTMFNTGRADQLNQILAQHATNFQQAQALKLSLVGKQQQLAEQVNAGLMTPVQAQMEYEQHMGQLINGLASAYPGQVYTNDSAQQIGNFNAGLGRGAAITPSYNPIAPQPQQPGNWQDYLAQLQQFLPQQRTGVGGVPLATIQPQAQPQFAMGNGSNAATLPPSYDQQVANLMAAGPYDYGSSANYNSTAGLF